MSVSTEPLAVTNLADQLCERLTEAILTGDLAPGSRISEATLARKFGISRGPLREALYRLEGQKLVQRVPNAGVRVIAPTRHDLLECYAVREPLEGMAVRLATEKMSEQEIASLGAMLDQHEAILTGHQERPADPLVGDFDFHFAIISACGNDKLVEILCDQLYYIIRMFRIQTGTHIGVSESAYQDHRHIYEAMAARDGATAEKHMRDHVRGAIADYQRVFAD